MIVKRIAWCAIAALTVWQAPVVAQDKPPLVLTPASAWNVNYANDSCRLARTFTDGSDKAVFLLDHFGAGTEFNVLVAGKFFESHTGRKIRLSFGPAGATRVLGDQFGLEFGTFGPAIAWNSTRLIDAPAVATSEDIASPQTAQGTAPPLPEPIATPEQEAAITWFEVQRGHRPAVRFALGPMDKPMEALRKCTDELLSHWGIDVVAHKTLTKKPTPASNPATWLSSSDYPRNLAARGAQGIVQFRLSVATDGTVSACHIQQSTRPAEFDKAVCQALSKRARFEPAIDASGKPINSYWRSSARFQMGR